MIEINKEGFFGIPFYALIVFNFNKQIRYISSENIDRE